MKKKNKSFFASLADLFKPSNNVNVIGRYDPVFLILILLLLCFGLVTLFSASYANALYYRGNSFHHINRQLIRTVIGLAGMFIIAKLEYYKYKPLAFSGFVLGVLLLIAVLFSKPDKNGIRRWIYIGPIQFQPSELVKFALIVFLATIISNNYKKMHTFRYGVLKPAIAVAIIVALMLKQPHLSGIVLMCSIAGVMLFVGGTQPKWFIILFLIALTGLLYMMFFKGNYMSSRAYGWLHPFSSPLDKTMQTDQSLLAIGSSGFFGLGLGQSRQKFMFLPEVQNDFIFAVICEELGVIGAVALMFLFLCFSYKGFEIATKTSDIFGTLLCTGIVIQFVMQAILNIAVVTATVPNTGISLPFFSYGGTALVVQLWELGVVLNISAHANTPKLLKIKSKSKSKLQTEIT